MRAHEPECEAMHGPNEDRPRTGACIFCHVSRRAYHRGRDELAKNLRKLHYPVTSGGCSDPDCCSPFDSEQWCFACQNDYWPCTTIELLEGEQD